MYAPETHLIARPKKKPIGLLVCVSVLLHIGIALVLSVGHSDKPVKKTSSPDPIKATLVFPPIKPPQILPRQEVIKEMPTHVSVAEKDKKESAPKLQPETAQESEAIVSNAPDVSPDAGKKSATIVTSQDLAKQHLQHYFAEKNNDLAKQAASEYRTKNNNPVMPKLEIDPFKTADEALLEDVAVKVNCQSSAGGTVAMLSGFLGGTLTCNDLPSVDEFINKRIHKDNK